MPEELDPNEKTMPDPDGEIREPTDEVVYGDDGALHDVQPAEVVYGDDGALQDVQPAEVVYGDDGPVHRSDGEMSPQDTYTEGPQG